jgi:putative membrane protein
MGGDKGESGLHEREGTVFDCKNLNTNANDSYLKKSQCGGHATPPPQRPDMLAAMTKVLIRWLLLAGALLLVAHLYPGVIVKSFTSALIAAFVLGLLNTLLRPVLVLLTLPVTVLSLGLFLFIINALMFWMAATVLDGLAVTGFAAALIGSLIYSLCGMVIDVVVERVFPSD